MRKYKVLIIDDEYLIIQGLKILIDWESCGCEIVGGALDGRQGLKMIEELQPDIVITDIRMPNISGIEMIRSALLVCGCKFIVLSGYSDFNYARQCMSLGVQEYLVKPVEEELLTASVERIKERLETESRQQDAMEKMASRNAMLEKLSMDYFLRDFVNTYFEEPEDFGLTLREYEIRIPEGKSYACALLQLPDCRDRLLKLRDSLAGCLEEEFKGRYLLFSYNEDSYMCILSLKAGEDKELLTEKLTAVKARISNMLAAVINIGVGNPYGEMHRISLSARQASQAMAFRIVRGEGSLNSFSGGLGSAHYILSIPKELIGSFSDSISLRNFADVSLNLRKIYDYLKELSDMPLLGIQINSLNLILICLQRLEELDAVKQPVRYEEMNCFDQIARLDSADEIARYVENVVYNLISTVSESDLKKAGGVIAQVENYIHDHICEDLSLMSIARMFYISPIYLSRLFKKETGRLYIDYLTDLKMNAAVRLLQSTDMMVYEVADKLGYKDSKYFSRLFEKKIGCRPSECRKKI